MLNLEDTLPNLTPEAISDPAAWPMVWYFAILMGILCVCIYYNNINR